MSAGRSPVIEEALAASARTPVRAGRTISARHAACPFAGVEQACCTPPLVAEAAVPGPTIEVATRAPAARTTRSRFRCCTAGSLLLDAVRRVDGLGDGAAGGRGAGEPQRRRAARAARRVHERGGEAVPAVGGDGHG